MQILQRNADDLCDIQMQEAAGFPKTIQQPHCVSQQLRAANLAIRSRYAAGVHLDLSKRTQRRRNPINQPGRNMKLLSKQSLVPIASFAIGAFIASLAMMQRSQYMGGYVPVGEFVSVVAAEGQRVSLLSSIVQVDLLQSGREAQARDHAAGQLASNLEILASMMEAGQMSQDVASRLCNEDLSPSRKPRAYLEIIRQQELKSAMAAYEQLSAACSKRFNQAQANKGG